jgi:hypothetical protein
VEPDVRSGLDSNDSDVTVAVSLTLDASARVRLVAVNRMEPPGSTLMGLVPEPRVAPEATNTTDHATVARGLLPATSPVTVAVRDRFVAEVGYVACSWTPGGNPSSRLTRQAPGHWGAELSIKNDGVVRVAANPALLDTVSTACRVVLAGKEARVVVSRVHSPVPPVAARDGDVATTPPSLIFTNRTMTVVRGHRATSSATPLH